MKKNDILKAIDSKKKTEPVKKKKTKKPKTPQKKKNITIESIKPREVISTNREDFIKEQKTITGKQRVKRVFTRIGIVLLLFIILFLVFFRVTEYRPEKVEKVEVTGEGFNTLNPKDSFSVMTWNIGYGALGDNADYFMDNGKMVETADRNRINKNLYNIRMKLTEEKPQIIFLQEVDISSKRTKHVNELSLFRNHLSNYSSTYANNFKVTYLPYPIPTIGRVQSGITTFSKYEIESAKRVSLPNPFKWPVRMFNLKRCALISYVPITGTDKKLVLINVHLEAYDNGKGKEKQTKELLKLMKKEQDKGNYIIVGGDFNQLFSSIDNSMYPIKDKVWTPGKIDTKVFGEGWQFVMDNSTPTCRSLDKPYVDADKDSFQYYMIDGFIISENIKVNEVKTKDYGFEHSDHNPVVVKLTLS